MSEPASEPPLLAAPDMRSAAVVRVTVGLVLFGVVDLVQDVTSIIDAFKAAKFTGNFHVSLPFGFLAFWIAAWLVWSNKRIIWPILAYLAAMGLGGMAGSGLVCVIGVPQKLIHAFAVNAPGWFGIYLTYLVLTTAFFAWLLVEACRVDWQPAFTAPRSSWLRPKAFAAYSVLFSILVTGAFLALMTGTWTEPVLARARQKLGNDYDYQVMSYNFRTVNGHTTHRAVVLAYSETEFNQVALNWED